jgi:hypothetical protein
MSARRQQRTANVRLFATIISLNHLLTSSTQACGKQIWQTNVSSEVRESLTDMGINQDIWVEMWAS